MVCRSKSEIIKSELLKKLLYPVIGYGKTFRYSPPIKKDSVSVLFRSPEILLTLRNCIYEDKVQYLNFHVASVFC